MQNILSRSRIVGIWLILLGNLLVAGELKAASTSPNLIAYEYAELNNCVIPAGASTCTASLAVYGPSGMTYTVKNLTRGITTTNLITPNNYIPYGGTYAYVIRETLLSDSANRLTYGDNDLIIMKSGNDIASMKAVGNASCASGSTWNGQICTSSNPPIQSGSTTSIVTLRTGNGDTVYSYDIPKNISKNYYTPEQVEKKINIPSTTSVLNITLSSTKERCSINPNYTTDSGMSFSSNSKDFMKSDLQSATMMLPIYSTYATPLNPSVAYGKISSISIGCDNYNDPVKDLIVFKIFFLTTLPPVIDYTLQASNCTILSGRGSCVSTVSLNPAPNSYFNLENVTRGLTMTNAFIPGGTTTISTSILGEQASNYLTNGVNSLKLKQGDALITTAQATGTCANGSLWNGQICATASTPTNYFVTLEAKNCTIAIGKSTCASTVNVTSTKYIGTTGGRTFDYKNFTRNITTANLFTPNNVTLNSAGYPVYTVSTSTSGDAANYATNGVNDFALIEGGIAIAKTTMTATCATGSTWNGQMCAENAPVFIDFQVNNCLIPAGKNTCHTAVYVGGPTGRVYSLENISRSLTSFNIITPNNYNTTLGKYFLDPAKTVSQGDTANVLKYGMNYLKLKSGTPDALTLTTISSATADASCAAGTTWNGQICAAPLPTPPLTISCTKSTYEVGEEVSCQISGGIGIKSCWQTGTVNTNPIICSNVGWALDGSIYYYYKTVTEAMVGNYTISVRDESGKTASTQVRYSAPYQEFITENCTIPSGKSSCVSTFYLVNPGTGKSYDVKNVTRNITTKNFFTPNSIGSLPGSNYPVYKSSTLVSGASANVGTFGTNSILLLDINGISLLKSAFVASCATGTTWNGQMCATAVIDQKPTINFMNRNPKVLSSGQTMYQSWGTSNASTFSYYCKGNGPVANKKVYIELNKPTFSGTWSDLIAQGWTGVYECDFVAEGPGGKATLADSFAILPSGSAGNPGSNYTDFQANNCTIAVGQSKCASTIYVTAPEGKYFSVKNVTRGTLSTNLLNQNNYTFIAGFNSPVYTVGINPNGDAANYATFGINNFILYNGLSSTDTVAKATMTATCAIGSSWNGKICTTSPVACTMEMRYCEDGSAMPRDPNTCEWLPGKCMPLPPATSVILGSFTINDRSYDYTGGVITLKESDVLSLKGMSRPGSSIYFYREGQSVYETVGASSTSGEWNLSRIWTPVGSKVIVPGENIYRLSGFPPNLQDPILNTQSTALIAIPEYVIRIKVISASSPYDVTLEAKNCTIEPNKRTCASTVNVTSTKYIGTTGGRTFDYKNFTRNITTSNLFTPNNVTINSAGYPVYTVSTNTLGDAANYATYGVNDFALIEGGIAVAKTTMTASCATGTTWNGQMCTYLPPVDPVVPIQTGTILPRTTLSYAKMTSCIIPEGSSTCPSTLMIFAQSGKTFTVKNVTRNVESVNSINSENFYIVSGRGVYISKGVASGPGAQQLTNGVNYITIKENSLVPTTISTRAIARCVTGTTWDGSKCAKKTYPIFSAKTYETARGLKNITSTTSISFDPTLDKYLILRGDGPVGMIQVTEGGGSSINTSTTVESTGKWKLTLNLTNPPISGDHVFMIWDGSSTTTATRVSVSIKPPTTQVNSVQNNTNQPSQSSQLQVEMITL